MVGLKLKSRAEQVADYLRGQIAAGRWGTTIPGVHRLATEMGVNFKTVIEAMNILESQGAVSAQGAGRKRAIVSGSLDQPTLRVGLMPYEADDLASQVDREIVHQLQMAGHHVKAASKSLCDLSMDPGRIGKFASRMDVDAWVVCAGSPEVLEWFAKQDKPVFALFGRSIGLNIASVAPRKVPAMEQAVARLVEFGHRRIVMLTREERRKPVPALFEQAFLDTLASHGIETSRYNLPDWDNHKQGFQHCIDELFRITPPTALLIGEPAHYVAAIQRLAKMGMVAPERISMICGDPSPEFSWCNPEISHIAWDHKQAVKRVLSWVNHIAQGKDDRERTMVKATFFEGGTIGPVPSTEVQPLTFQGKGLSREFEGAPWGKGRDAIYS